MHRTCVRQHREAHKSLAYSQSSKQSRSPHLFLYLLSLHRYEYVTCTYVSWPPALVDQLKCTNDSIGTRWLQDCGGHPDTAVVACPTHPPSCQRRKTSGLVLQRGRQTSPEQNRAEQNIIVLRVDCGGKKTTPHLPAQGGVSADESRFIYYLHSFCLAASCRGKTHQERKCGEITSRN